ncbi:hypothetical protein FQV26_04330 [Planococcus sp. CPCC 101016]|uniref:S-layer homology domain-containing protein n=1 Tax=Planococcus sp. CPCC 101016 TaxID=2599617 RepID=UPI0011B3B962|nr:S-layer homology domain-containing protein [Planococcus sp. CPCC 101016]TWT07047.1 hypothetical protein FQV26_04330 [Planococcus sp. CPCC 101016]
MKKLIYKNLWVFFSIFLLYFIMFFSVEVKAEQTVNVMDFGAKGNNLTDDTKAFQDAINFQSKAGGGTVKVPEGIYLINTNNSVVLKSNITLDFEKNSILKAIANDRDHYEVIRIIDVENVKILGELKIQGDRDYHLGETGEWGFGISIRGAKNITIENPHISNCWGDGIYIGSSLEAKFSENIQILNPTLINNRRQGISIISAKNLEIVNANISNTSGTLPESGIDIEPNTPEELLQNIRITNLTTKDNAQYGFKIFLRNLKLSENPVSIEVDSIANITDGIAVKEIEGVKGTILIGGYYYLSDREIISKPLANIPTSTSTTITGTALAGSSISVKAGTTVIGTAKTTGSGNYTIPIPTQKAGTIISVTAKDAAGNVSKETKVTVVAEKFSDLEFSNWFYDEILYLIEKNIVQGFPNGSFQPNKNTTRAEAAKMLATALKIPASNKKTEYSDLSSDHWASSDIAAVTSAGLFNGYADGTFKPNKNITRAEMAKVLALAYNLGATNEQVYKDVPSTHWASKSVSGITQNGIATGYPDNTFRPSAATSRAEFSVFLARALNNEFK